MKAQEMPALEIVEELSYPQGWNMATKYAFLTEFIDSRKEGPWLRKFLKKKAREENGFEV